MTVNELIELLQQKREQEKCGDWPIVMWYGDGVWASQISSLQISKFAGNQDEGKLYSHIFKLDNCPTPGRLAIVITPKKTRGKS